MGGEDTARGRWTSPAAEPPRAGWAESSENLGPEDRGIGDLASRREKPSLSLSARL